MGYTYKYGVPATTEPQSPQEEYSVADDILVKRTLFPGLGGAPDRYTYEAFGTVTPTSSNCPLPCPAVYHKTDSSASVTYVATGVVGSVCTGWSAQA